MKKIMKAVWDLLVAWGEYRQKMILKNQYRWY
jgi:hypothetical protein